jgi:hypothetical protein
MEVVVCSLKYYSEICLVGLNTTMKSLGILGVSNVIRTGHIPRKKASSVVASDNLHDMEDVHKWVGQPRCRNVTCCA